VAFLVINLPGNIQPLERGDRFEDPLMAAFDAEGVEAEFTGGGSELGEVDGQRVVVSCDIEVEVEDVERALRVIRRVLLAAGAPAETVIKQLEPETAIYRLQEPS
jgi:hypothetical protein